MSKEHLLIKKSEPLRGSVKLVGAKNAVLTIMASLLLTKGTSILKNVYPQAANNIYHVIYFCTASFFAQVKKILDFYEQTVKNWHRERKAS